MKMLRLRHKVIAVIWILFCLLGLIIYFLESVWLNSDNSTAQDRSLSRFYKYKPTIAKANNYIIQKYGSNITKIDSKSNLFKGGDSSYDISSTGKNYKDKRKTDVVLAVVACGDRLHETLVMIKSAILFSSNTKLSVIVVADFPLIKGFEEKLGEWKVQVNDSFTYEIHPISFPENGKEEWRKLFKPCAAQRLFLPNVLKDVDSILYVDTDTLFLGPLEDVWVHFSRMNSSQMPWLLSTKTPTLGGTTGVNSGVMLMNLTRMRQFGWVNYLAPIHKEFKLKITWGDQDIINIIFHYHPERLYVYSCRYNYRSDHCMYMSVCKDANKNGVAVIHGSRGTFHGNKQPAFKAIFSCMEEYQLGSDPYQNLLLPMEHSLAQTSHTNCGKVRSILTKNLHKYISLKEPFR